MTVLSKGDTPTAIFRSNEMVTRFDWLDYGEDRPLIVGVATRRLGGDLIRWLAARGGGRRARSTVIGLYSRRG